MQRMVVTLTVFMWGVALSSTGQAQVLSPRIAPLAEDQWTVNVRSGISGFGVTAQSVTNLHRTLARHPAALHGLGPLNTYLMGQSMVAAVDQLLMGDAMVLKQFIEYDSFRSHHASELACSMTGQISNHHRSAIQ